MRNCAEIWGVLDGVLTGVTLVSLVNEKLAHCIVMTKRKYVHREIGTLMFPARSLEDHA